MQVAFLADALYYPMVAGTTRVTYEVSRHLAMRADIDLRLITAIRHDIVEALARQRGYPVAETIPGRSIKPGLQYLLWHLGGLPGGIAKMTDCVDVVHSPHMIVPPRLRPPLVVTVLDLTFVLFPGYHTRHTRLIAGTGLSRAAREAQGFIAISEHTRNDMIRLTNIPKERIHVVPLAADERFTPQPHGNVASRYGIDAPYVLYVGTLEPRKNLLVLLRAFNALQDRSVKLILAGAKGWMYDEIMQTTEQLGCRDRVILTGFVAHEDLPGLISEARVFVYPSLYEGFGLPVLEAMQCNTPVITTNVSSIPEVAGDAALYVAPNDVEGLTRQLDRLLASPDLRSYLCGKGLEQTRRFSWQRTADMTVDVYASVVRRVV